MIQGFLYAFVLAFLLIMATMPMVISVLRRLNIGQMIQADGPKHAQKHNTPTMAGVWLVLAMVIVSLYFCRWNNPLVWLVLGMSLLHMIIGAVDDMAKLYYKNNDLGLRARDKFLLQTVVALLAVWCWSVLFVVDAQSQLLLRLPGFVLQLDLTYGYYLLAVIMLVGTSNAVNLTDGLDGLVSLPIVCVCLGMLAYLMQSGLDGYPALWHLAAYRDQVIDLGFVLAAAAGVCMGFLWFNCHPAQVFMGDSGSLAFGSMLATVAMVLKMELLFVVLTGLFVIEACSVILQVLYYKKSRQRLFKMAPIHHHFELCGWPEVQVVTRFWLMSIVFLCISTMMML